MTDKDREICYSDLSYIHFENYLIYLGSVKPLQRIRNIQFLFFEVGLSTLSLDEIKFTGDAGSLKMIILNQEKLLIP